MFERLWNWYFWPFQILEWISLTEVFSLWQLDNTRGHSKITQETTGKWKKGSMDSRWDMSAWMHIHAHWGKTLHRYAPVADHINHIHTHSEEMDAQTCEKVNLRWFVCSTETFLSVWKTKENEQRKNGSCIQKLWDDLNENETTNEMNETC